MASDTAGGRAGKSKRKPRHLAVYGDLRSRLEKGDFPVGGLLPTEVELCAEYKVSRYALREAIRLLERQGFIQRRRRAGTRVLAHTARNIFRHATATRMDLVEFVSNTTIKFSVPRLIQTDNKLARFLGCDEMRQWHLLEGTRIDAADQRPIGITQIYIDATRVGAMENVDFCNRFVYEWLEEKYGIRTSTISQDITAVSLNASQAKIFGERPGAPALRIMRRYFDDARKIFQIVVTTHRSEGFVYNTRLQLE